MLKIHFKSIRFEVCMLLLLVTVPATLKAELVADGVSLMSLTADGQSRAVAWAYHGDWIGVLRDIPGSRQNQLFVIKADGTDERPVTTAGIHFL